MKKFACFALTAALLLAGCGGTDGDNAAQSQTEDRKRRSGKHSPGEYWPDRAGGHTDGRYTDRKHRSSFRKWSQH